MFITQQERIIKKLMDLSEKNHKLSLLFYEFSQSLKIKQKKENLKPKQFKEYLKSLNLDYDKIIALNSDLKNISFKELKGGNKNA